MSESASGDVVGERSLAPPGVLPNGRRVLRGVALVVDDDPDARALVATSLAREGFGVVDAASATDARRVLRRRSVDLVMLEPCLPDDNGLRLLEELRTTSSVPVVIVSASAATSDRVAGLRRGADDYVSKPFAPSELEARIDAVFRRARNRVPGQPLMFDDGLTVDVEAREVSRGPMRIDLRPREFELLVELATHPRRVYSRHELLHCVWNSSHEWQTPATVTEHVRKLRRAIEADPNHPRHLITVRGVGYRFDP